MKKEKEASSARQGAAKQEAARKSPVAPAAGKKPGLSERDRNMLLGALAVVAICAAAYVIFFSGVPDNPADGSEFYARLESSGSVGLLYDVRGAQPEQASAIYQCGVDMISKGRFAGKSLEIIACESGNCIDSSPDRNGTRSVTYDEAVRTVSAFPYILIKPGTPSYKFFQKHMEISIGQNVTGNVTCDISATEG